MTSCLLLFQTVASVVGHLDYSFASSWHPEGRIFATGNQDKTCRVWDIRNLSVSIAVLKGNLGAVRSIHFSSDGQFLVAAEPADFVHIYNAKGNFKIQQEIDFFGEISGVSLSPDDESIYIGLWDLFIYSFRGLLYLLFASSSPCLSSYPIDKISAACRPQRGFSHPLACEVLSRVVGDDRRFLLCGKASMNFSNKGLGLRCLIRWWGWGGVD
ncbi:hypothetical protein M9H77_30421 [Catharanthus roseus]|uniref:Uncharacterized protein n=1 Tax=Catharanthus roseus TaxID=4058 RepID=A0ACB9ZZ82_CATRO|nr:hypothetical protein M9H77_30421 [Catharanthus roseus]